MVARRRPGKDIQDEGVFDDSPSMLPEHPTAQELFDFVCRHFNAQGGPAGNRNEDIGFVCFCRAKDGKACAFGCLMTDEEAIAVDASELAPLQAIDNLQALRQFNVRFGTHKDLLESLRDVHDTCTSERWLNASLESIAAENQLDFRHPIYQWSRND